ncbi:MAG: thiamine-binding protein [Longimicrobiales bacterium]
MLFGISVYSFGEGDSQVKPVASVVEQLATSGIPYRVHAMQTVAEGEWEQVMPVLQEAYQRLMAKYDRVYMSVSIDQHGGLSNRLEGAINDLEKELGHPIAR